MTDNLDWLSDDDSDSPGDLRKALEKANKRAKALEAELGKRDETIAELTGKVKATSLRDALTEAGVDPKFAKIAERDGVEPTKDAVLAWRKENEGIYAFAPAESAESSEDDGDAEGEAHEDHVDDALQQQMQAGQSLEGAGHPSGSSTITDALRAARQNLGQFKSEEEVDEFLRKHGAPSLSSLGGNAAEE